jgi:hypothetical protein
MWDDHMAQKIGDSAVRAKLSIAGLVGYEMVKFGDQVLPRYIFCARVDRCCWRKRD